MRQPIITAETVRLPQSPSKGGKIIEAAVYILLTVFFAWAAIAEGVQLASGGVKSAAISLAMLLLIAAALWLTARAENKYKLSIGVILMISAALRIAYVFLVPTVPSSDFSLLYNMALETADGNFSWADVTEGYFALWRYQIPFIAYEAVIIRLTHSIAALKLMNVVWSVGITALIAIIVSKFAPKRCALASALLYAVHPGQIMFNSVLTNQHISMFFLLLGIYLLISAKNTWLIVLSGVTLAVGNMMRPEGIIIIAAAACVMLCSFIERPGTRRLAELALAFIILLAVYFLTQKAAELVLRLIGLAPYGIGNSAPEWKFIVGLNYETMGTLTSQDTYIMDIADSAQRHEEAMRVIKSYIEGNGNWAAFLYEKLKYFWISAEDCIFTLSGLYMNGSLAYEDITSALSHFELVERFAAYALAGAGCAMLARKAGKREKSEAIMPLIAAAVICGTAIIYLFIEIQPRYRYFAIPFVFMLAGFSISRMTGKHKKDDKQKER